MSDRNFLFGILGSIHHDPDMLIHCLNLARLQIVDNTRWLSVGAVGKVGIFELKWVGCTDALPGYAIVDTDVKRAACRCGPPGGLCFVFYSTCLKPGPLLWHAAGTGSQTSGCSRTKPSGGRIRTAAEAEEELEKESSMGEEAITRSLWKNLGC
jgi:hypothetical protein